MEQTIADRIRIIRTIKRLTQENVADEIGITHGAYAKIERGETDPNTSRLQDIAKALKVSVSDFFNEKDPDITEDRNPYGYASKTEVDNLSHVVRDLIKEVKELREEISKPKPRKPRKK